jgi:carboxylesterase type B
MDAIVQTRQGALRGTIMNGVHTFKGVPFAAPPIGHNRLRPPQPVDAWSGVRDALVFGAKPSQMRMPPEFEAMIPDPSAVGDDCLNLNIWSMRKSGKFPAASFSVTSAVLPPIVYATQIISASFDLVGNLLGVTANRTLKNA